MSFEADHECVAPVGAPGSMSDQRTKTRAMVAPIDATGPTACEGWTFTPRKITGFPAASTNARPLVVNHGVVTAAWLTVGAITLRVSTVRIRHRAARCMRVLADDLRMRVTLCGGVGGGKEVGRWPTRSAQPARYRAIENPRQESPIARILWSGWRTIASILESQLLPPNPVATLPSPPKLGSSRPPVV